MATANTTAIAKVEPQGAVALHWSNEQVDTIRRTVARDANDTELKMFLHLSETYGLDPFAKEIWCIKMGGRPTIMTSRDGYLKIANRNPHFKGMRADVVYEGDSFQKVGDEVKHVYGIQNRGKPVGAYCFVYRDDRNYPIYVYAPFKDYYKSGGTWNTYPHAMILKVAEAQALKRAFSISGLVTQEELDNGDVYVVENNGSARARSGAGQGRDVKKELWNGFLSCCGGDANKAKAEIMKITEGRGSAEWTDEDLKSLEAALVVYKGAKASDATSNDMLKGAIQDIKTELWQGFLNVCNADAEKAKAEIMKITEGRGSVDWTDLDMINLRRVLDEKVLEAIDVQYTEDAAMAEAADAAGMPVPKDEAPIKKGQSDNTVDLREKMIQDIESVMGDVGLGFTQNECEDFYTACVKKKKLKDVPISGLSKILFEARKLLDERISAEA